MRRLSVLTCFFAVALPAQAHPKPPRPAPAPAAPLPPPAAPAARGAGDDGVGIRVRQPDRRAAQGGDGDHRRDGGDGRDGLGGPLRDRRRQRAGRDVPALLLPSGARLDRHRAAAADGHGSRTGRASRWISRCRRRRRSSARSVRTACAAAARGLLIGDVRDAETDRPLRRRARGGDVVGDGDREQHDLAAAAGAQRAERQRRALPDLRRAGADAAACASAAGAEGERLDRSQFPGERPGGAAIPDRRAAEGGGGAGARGGEPRRARRPPRRRRCRSGARRSSAPSSVGDGAPLEGAQVLLIGTTMTVSARSDQKRHLPARRAAVGDAHGGGAAALVPAEALRGESRAAPRSASRGASSTSARRCSTR